MFKNLLFALALFAASCSADREEFLPDTPPPVVHTSSEVSAFYSDVLEEVNALRTRGCRCGDLDMPAVAPLVIDAKLNAAADRHAYDMEQNSFFDHTGTDGSKSADRASDADYLWRAVGENIALHPGTISDVIEGWKNSPGHCRNMMNADYADMGIACRGDYWVQVLGAKIGE